MEHLDNDMDDLFRKAGDHYPLRITESDWDAVLGKLRDEIPGNELSIPAVVPKTDRHKRRWFFLLFLIPIGLGALTYFTSGNKSLQNISIPNDIKTYPQVNKSDQNASDLNEATPRAVRIDNQNGLPLSKNKGHAVARTGIAYLKTGKQSTGNSTTENIDMTAFNSAKSIPVKEKSISATVAMSEQIISVKANALSMKGILTDSLTENKPQQKEKHKENKKFVSAKGFYAGLLVGPDLSSVDLQSVKQPGFSLGVLIGYRFGNRLSLEAGLLWDKKYYYSDGSHFDKSGTSIPSSETVLNLNGYCNMFEIPIAIRYDFAAKNKHVFFAKVGLSSYLMKKENYDINGSNYGMPVSYPATYYNSGNHFLSILGLSAGYELAIDGKNKIRVEPYLKIPLQGIGIGKMPISSAGFYLGFSHSFR